MWLDLWLVGGQPGWPPQLAHADEVSRHRFSSISQLLYPIRLPLPVRTSFYDTGGWSRMAYRLLEAEEEQIGDGEPG